MFSGVQVEGGRFKLKLQQMFSTGLSEIYCLSIWVNSILRNDS